MKIDVIGTRGFPGIQGGVERHCERLYPCMEGVSVRVFRRKPFLNPEYKGISYPNIRFKDLPSTRISGIEAVFHSFVATLISAFSQTDIVHIHNIGPAMFAPLLRLAGKKVVLTFHSANYEHDKWSRLEKLILKMSERIALNAANRIIFVNKFQLEKYSGRIQRKSCYIPNGIVPLGKTDQTGFIRNLGTESGKYILSVGRITPEKGFDILIDAFDRIETDLKLVIAGAPDQGSDYLDRLRAKAQNDRIIFAGFVDGENLAQLYSHAAAYVLSSRVEGFPLVLLEAINFGLPLLVSDIPASHLLPLPSLSYFKASDSFSLAAKLREFLQTERESYVCRNISISDFSWENIARQTKEVYQQANGTAE